MINPWKDYSETTEYRIAPDGMDGPRTISRVKALPLNVYGAYYDAFFRDITAELRRAPEERLEKRMEERLESLRGERSGLANLIFHYLYTEDRNNAVTPLYVYKIYCENLIARDGAFGEKIRASFCALSPERKNVVLFYMVLKYVFRREGRFFADALRELFRHVRLIPTREKLIFWTSETDSPENRAALNLCKALFLDLGEIVDSYWGAPVGVVGEAMRIGDVQAVYPLED